MARKISVAGRVTGIPNVYQDKIELVGGSKPGPLESGVVCIIGECEGAIEPKVPYVLRNSQALKELLGSGDLYDAARFAFDPSREDPQEVRGASKVIAVRANPATQSTLALKSPTSADLIDLTSVAYGAKANQISVAVAAGTDAGPSKKLTVSQMGVEDEVGDNLGYNSVFLIRYTGNGSAATMNISRTQLTTSLTGASDGSANLTIAFSTYDTITKLVAYINAQTGYEAVAITSKPDSFKCQDLDFVNTADIKTASGSVTINDSSTSLTLAGLSNGDVVGCESEYMYVTTAGSPNTVIRGYNDTTPAAHTAATGYRWYNGTGVNQAVIEWITNYSTRLYAVRESTYNIGIINTLSETFLSGGGEGSIANSDWQDALDAVRTEKYNFIVVTALDATVQGYLKTHLNDKWGTLGQEAIGHVGITKDSTKAQIKLRAKTLQSANISLWFQDVNRENAQGSDTNYAPWALASMAAGIQAGSAIGTPLTNKSLNVTAIDQASSIDLNDDTEDFIEYGVCVARYDGDEYRIVRALSTYTNTDDQYLIAPNVRSALAWTVYKVRYWVKYRHIGKKSLKGNAQSIKSTAETALEECRDIDEAIVDGSKIVGGRRVDIPAYSDIQVSQTGNVSTLTYNCTPVDGTDFVKVSTYVQPFQDVATS